MLLPLRSTSTHSNSIAHTEPGLIRVPTRHRPHTHACFVLPRLQKPSGSRSRSFALPKSHEAANSKQEVRMVVVPTSQWGHKEGSSVQGEPSSQTTAAEGSQRFQGPPDPPLPVSNEKHYRKKFAGIMFYLRDIRAWIRTKTGTRNETRTRYQPS